MDAVIIVSTHGSAAPGGAIGWAWINHAGGQFDSGGAARGNDQVAALSALLKAIEAHPGDEPLLVESGSQYAIRSVSEWSEGWKRNDWRSPSGDPVPNLDLVQGIDSAVTERTGPTPSCAAPASPPSRRRPLSGWRRRPRSGRAPGGRGSRALSSDGSCSRTLHSRTGDEGLRPV